MMCCWQYERIDDFVPCPVPAQRDAPLLHYPAFDYSWKKVSEGDKLAREQYSVVVNQQLIAGQAFPMLWDDYAAQLFYNGGVRSVEELKRGGWEKLLSVNNVGKTIAPRLMQAIEAWKPGDGQIHVGRLRRQPT